MSSDKKEGKGCMVFMNVLLLILGILIIGFTIYVNSASDIPPVVQQVGAVLGMGITTGIVLIVFAVIGFCASCGGCFLFVYCIFITILSIVLVVGSIAMLVVWFSVKNLDDEGSSVISIIDNATIAVISQDEYKEQWVQIQDALSCCGYQGVEMTGASCSAQPEITDCRNLIYNTLINYSLWYLIIIVVTTVVVIILNCASCARLKSDCRG